MESIEKVPCSICLEPERNTTLLVDFWKKQCYLQIIDEIRSPQTPSPPVWLCYECEALLSRFTRFKIRVKNAYQVLQKFVLQDLPPPSSTLTTTEVLNLSYDPKEKYTSPYKVYKFKTTKVPDTDVSDELSSSWSDDDKVLIEYSSKRKRKRKKKKAIDMWVEVELDEDQVNEERRQMQLVDDYVNAMFRCESCIITFPNEHDLNDHKNAKHLLNVDKIICKICACAFATDVSYKSHKIRHTRRYECDECGSRYNSQRAARMHYEQMHCFESMSRLVSIRSKIQEKKTVNEKVEDKTVMDSESYPCPQCDKTFRWKTSLRKHTETHRIETGLKRRPYCEACRLSFSSTANLQKHVKASSKHQIQLKLRKLTANLAEDINPEKHQADIEEIKTSVTSSRQLFACTLCDKRFQWRGNFLRHYDSHTARAKGELVCVPCNRTFSSIATFKQHMKISKKHVTENDFKFMCSDCGKRFANKTRLKDHVDWEHLKRYVHKCGHCEKVFRSRTSLYLHQAAHRVAEARLCHHCGKGFSSHTKLRAHIAALHSRSTPYSCTRCGARFSWHSCLSRHVRRVHREDKSDGGNLASKVLTDRQDMEKTNV